MFEELHDKDYFVEGVAHNNLPQIDNVFVSSFL